MNRNTWRSLASVLLAATLSLGIAACDDDTSSGTGDMGAGGADMSANADMAMTGTPGIGQIVLADVVGTVYTTQPAPEDVLYRTHALVALASMPVVTPMSDPSSDLSLTPPGGCTINRFTQTNPPPSDGDAGAITISGWNQAVIGVSAVTGTAATGDTMYPVGCSRGGPLMRYTCGFAGMMNADGGGMGMTTNSVIFPLIKHKLVDHATGTTLATFPDWPAAFGDAACIPRVCGTVPTGTSCPTAGCDVICCEQSPVVVGTSNITEAVAGGTDYPAVSKMIGNDANMDAGVAFFPQPLYLVSVTQPGSSTNLAGTDPFTLGPSLSMADHAIDTSKDLVVSFSCDGSATVGSGCTGASDLAALLITTSTSTRAMFATSTATGSGECISTLPGGTVKIMANQLQALVGTQTGGSWQLALARLRLLVASAGSHTVALGGGMGVFGFTNQ